MATAPRIRIGQRLGPTPLALVATLDEIRLSVGAGRNLALTQTAPWPNPLEADPDVADTGWVDVTAHRTGLADETKRFTVTRTRRGDSGTAGLNSALVLIYKRSATLPAVPNLDATYTFASGISGLSNGWSASPQAGTDPLYVTAATASSAAAFDTIAPGEWAGPVIQVQSGLNSATVYLFQRTATNVAPALPGASVVYTFASGSATGITNGWAQSLPTTGGAFRWITTASALSTASTDTILATEWAAVALLAENGVNGSDGSNGVDGLNNALILIYKRSATMPAVPSVTATYSFSTGISGLNNGWTISPPAGSDPLYVTSATASSTGPSDTIAPGEWAGPVIHSQDGTSGLNSATVYLFQRTATNVAPALPGASVVYTFATGLATGITNGWAQSLPTTGGAFRWVTTASALGTGTTDTILSTEWAAVALLAQDGVDGAVGADGTTTPTLALSVTSVNFAADSTGLIDAGQSFTSTVQVTLGSTNDTSNWTLTPTTSHASISGTLAGAVVTLNSMGTAVDAGTVTITATRTGYAAQVATISVGKLKRSVPASGPAASPGDFFAHASAVSPSNATALVEFRRDGSIWGYENVYNGSASGNWYLPSGTTVGDNFQIRFDQISSSLNSTSSASSQWQTLSTPRSVSLANTTDTPNTKQTTVNYSIRPLAGGSTVASGTIYLNADVEI